MPVEQSVEMLAAALIRAAEEHGRPNSFSCGELEHFHCGPVARISGKIGKRHVALLHRALGGNAAWGAPPSYANGRFSI